MKEQKNLLDIFDDFEEKAEEIIDETKEIKQEIKKELKETPKAKQKAQTKQTRIPKAKKEDKYQKQIDNLMTQIKDLKESVIDHRERLIKEENPLVKALLQDIKARNLDVIVEELMKITGLDKFDYYVGSDHYCANMERIKKVIDPKKEPLEYQYARFINRIYKGDRKMYFTLMKYLNNRDKTVIENYDI